MLHHRLLKPFLMALCLVASAWGEAAPHAPLAETQSLIRRIAPAQAGRFRLETIPADQGHDVFEVEGDGDTVVLRGSGTQALARAFDWYLTTCCHTSVSWHLADPIELPGTLPPVREKVRQTCRFDKRFFLNYCTFGYTTLWWRWPEWERFIDWMALKGINMPLAITGEEYVWQRVWRRFGLTEEETRAFFSGPAHLPWHRMGNLDGWLGPLPQSFIDGQFQLQKLILGRERALGMTPVLPAFAGHTPKAIQRVRPGVKLTDLGSYETGAEHDAWFLDPMDPLFREIQKAFLKEQTALLGTDHYYGADPFNEMDPPRWEPEYLASVSRSIHRGMVDADPAAVWVQMGWTFYNDREHWTNPRLEAMIRAVPQDRMILLDYFCENTEVWRLTDAFFNAPFIWCYLGNFGGGTQLMGPLRKTASRLVAAEKDPNHRKLCGIGSTLEGFGINRAVYEWVFAYAWDRDVADTDAWIRAQARSRCGGSDPVAEEAWGRMLKVVYDQTVSGVGLGNVLEQRPTLDGKTAYTRLVRYDYATLADVWAQMLLAEPASLARAGYRHDLAQVARQVLVNLCDPVLQKALQAFKAGDARELERWSSLFLEIGRDVDRLQGAFPQYSMDRWLQEAGSFAAPDAPASYFQTNAKVLVTTWGPRGCLITDYAARDFGGLVRDYYLPRWSMFFEALRGSLERKETFDPKAFAEKAKDFEWAYTQAAARGPVPAEPAPASRDLYRKYVSYFPLLGAPVAK